MIKFFNDRKLKELKFLIIAIICQLLLLRYYGYKFLKKEKKYFNLSYNTF